MKLGRILGVILSILVFVICTNKYASEANNDNSNPFAFLSDSVNVIDNNTVKYGNTVVDMDNKDNIEVITYTNKNGYTVNLTQKDITVICNGSGSTKEADEALVSKNMKIKAAFSEDEHGKKYDSLLVNNRETVYIHVISTYSGDKLPMNEVYCDYSVNILAA